MMIKLSGQTQCKLTKELILMYYVGIDVAKQTHYAAVMNSDGEILVSPFPFSNNHTGFQLLLDNLLEFPK